MSLYIDSSALLKRYVVEADRERFLAFQEADSDWVTARHTSVEVRRMLARNVTGYDLSVAREAFARDWDGMTIVELDERVCDAGARIAETTGVRSLDALHLGAMERADASGLTLLTADRRQADAARALGWAVLGA